jgi:hypothetical protein
MALNDTFANQIANEATRTGEDGTSLYLLARVTHVVRGPYLQNTDIKDVYYKNPSNLGTITYTLIDSSQNGTAQSAGNPPAKPVYSSLKQCPLEGEYVLILRGPSIAMNESRDSADYFYLPPFNLWNSSQQNALPDLGDYNNYVNNIVRTYQQAAANNQPNNLSPTGSIQYPLGPDFVEKGNIKTLEQFVGDVTVEGRWGNSIRFGSTSLNKTANYWSTDNSSPGNPITILRNGQGRQNNDIAWIPTIENINRDPSSIYLTNGQKIVIDDISNNFSLASLGITLESTNTTSIPIQQQLTSIDTISPAAQDQRISNSNK